MNVYLMNVNSYAAIKIRIINFKWVIFYLLTSVNTYMHVKCNSLVEWFGTNGAFIFFTIPRSLQLIFTITTNRNMLFDNVNIIYIQNFAFKLRNKFKNKIGKS